MYICCGAVVVELSESALLEFLVAPPSVCARVTPSFRVGTLLMDIKRSASLPWLLVVMDIALLGYGTSIHAFPCAGVTFFLAFPLYTRSSSHQYERYWMGQELNKQGNEHVSTGWL
jgi:hypothetical protein